jgi:hypothetical protein
LSERGEATLGATDAAMAGEQFSPDLLGPIILEMRDRFARIEADIAVIKDTLEHHRDEFIVVSGLAMRADGSRSAAAALRPDRGRGTDRDGTAGPSAPRGHRHSHACELGNDADTSAASVQQNRHAQPGRARASHPCPSTSIRGKTDEWTVERRLAAMAAMTWTL